MNFSLASESLWKIFIRIEKCGWANFKVAGRERKRQGSSKQKDGDNCVWALAAPAAVGALASTKRAGIMGTSGRRLMVQPKDPKFEVR